MANTQIDSLGWPTFLHECCDSWTWIYELLYSVHRDATELFGRLKKLEAAGDMGVLV